MSEWQDSSTLRSERLCVRPWQSRDDVAHHAWPSYQDPFHELWNLPGPIKLGEGFCSLFHLSFGNRLVWAVDDTYQRLIGRVSLREVDYWKQRARLGISLGAPYVGRGLGTEALVLFLNYYFGAFGFATMILDVAALNQRAVRCYEHLGFGCVTHEWRNAGFDSSLHLLQQPAYQYLRPFFRRCREGTQVLFLEMELSKSRWLDQGAYQTGRSGDGTNASTAIHQHVQRSPSSGVCQQRGD